MAYRQFNGLWKRSPKSKVGRWRVLKIAALLISLLGSVFNAVTPELRNMLSTDISKWETAAKAGGNELEIVLVDALKGILGMS